MRLLVTGVTGFCGSHLAPVLAEAGHEVYGLTRRRPSGAVPYHPVFGDVATLESLPNGIAAIVHAAAVSPAPDTRTIDYILTNALGTENLARLAADGGVGKLVYFSSLSVHGEIAGPVADEATPVVNPDAYGASKLMGEMALRERADAVPALALRLPAVIGDGASRHWLARQIETARRGEPLRIFNPDRVFNNAIDVDDLARFVASVVERDLVGFDAVPLAADGGLAIRDIAERIVWRAGRKGEIVEESAPRPFFSVSNRRAKDAYGFTPGDFAEQLYRYLDAAFGG